MPGAQPLTAQHLKAVQSKNQSNLKLTSDKGGIAYEAAIILVGGNIRGQTRTMTTAIALQTSQGYLPMALGLGAVLLGLSIAVSGTVFSLAGSARDAGQDEEH